VLASNVRRDRKSPLDDGTAFTIRGLIPDPPRHRLIVVVQRFEPKQEVNGIWEYQPARGQWKQLVPMRLRLVANEGTGYGSPETVTSVSPARNGQISL